MTSKAHVTLNCAVQDASDVPLNAALIVQTCSDSQETAGFGGDDYSFNVKGGSFRL